MTTAHNIKAAGLAKVSGLHLSDAANEPSEFAQGETCAGDLTEADLERIDRDYAAARDSGAIDQQRADRAQALELARTPNGGYLHG